MNMKYLPLIFTIITLQIITFSHFSCHKEQENDASEIVIKSDISTTNSSLEDITIIQGRNGVNLESGLYFDETWSWDNFFVDSIRNHRLFNAYKIDSLHKKRIGTGLATLRVNNTSIGIADYEITFLYKNGDVEKINTISKIEKDGWYKKSSNNCLLSPINPNVSVFFQKEKNTIRFYNISTGKTINLNTWKISIKPTVESDVITIIENEKLYPIKTGSNQWSPLHIL